MTPLPDAEALIDPLRELAEFYADNTGPHAMLVVWDDGELFVAPSAALPEIAYHTHRDFTIVTDTTMFGDWDNLSLVDGH